MKISYSPVGRFHSTLSQETGAPRQGILQPQNSGIIEIFSEFSGATRNLEEYEYIIVLYHLNLSESWHTPVQPPGTDRRIGLFASRSPNRPNPIGFGVIRLERIENNKLFVSGIDAFDGTPVLDIKPWIPAIDRPEGEANLGSEKKLGL